MRRRHRESKRRAVSAAQVKKMENSSDSDQKNGIRTAILKEGACSVGVCGSEAACKAFENNTYTCLCPHDSKPPTIEGNECPRHTVEPVPHRIPNILPPGHKISENKTNSRNDKTSWAQPAESNFLGKHNLNIIISGSLGFIFILLLLFLIVRRRKHCCAKDKNSTSPSPMVLKRSLLVADRYAPNPQYTACSGTAVPILRKETLKFLNEIGEGCFGKVFKGELHAENSDQIEIVAIKVLKETATREAEDDFLREVDIMSTFRHTNILSLLGVVLRDTAASPMMVFEYMPYGDLAEVLRSQRKRPSSEDEKLPELGMQDLLCIALQIANGMRYLAAQRFVHRDLACRNCLVAEGPTVKIADFGMSRDVYTCDYYKIGGSRLLPVRWMSPESVLYGRFTLESDIWSYGVVLWEIYSFGKQPYYGHTNEEVVKLILQGIMLIPPEDCPSLICELMRSCWKTEPRDRMRFPDIYDKLLKEFDVLEEKVPQVIFEDELKQKCGSGKKLPRPPPLLFVPQGELLDPQGYLVPNELKEPILYLETLPD